MATVGERVLLAMERRGIGFNELDRALGRSPGYSSRMTHSDRSPRADTLKGLAEALGVSIAWLATGEGQLEGDTTPVPADSETRYGAGYKRLGDRPGWPEAEREARRRHRRMPDFAWRKARETATLQPPAKIDAETVFHFANAWLASASDEELQAAEEEEVREIMAREDEAARQKALPFTEPIPPRARRRIPK